MTEDDLQINAEEDDAASEVGLAIAHSGMATLAGRPNVGKSTLMNAMVGEKLAIVSPKPQTTRDQIRGILTTPTTQVVFIDTPGLHEPRSRLNRAMVGVAVEALESVDLVVMVVDSRQVVRGMQRAKEMKVDVVGQTMPGEGEALPPLDPRIPPPDRRIIHQIRQHGRKWMLVLNKIDLVKKPLLLPLMSAYGSAVDAAAMLPVSAKSGDGLEALVSTIETMMPPGPQLYGADELTDRSLRFLAAELIREQVFLQIEQEVPYGVAVEIELWDESAEKVHVQALVHVERTSQRGILIGRGGARLKAIGTVARREIERMLERKVFLQILIRVEPNWSERLATLRRFGYAAR